MGLIEQVTNNPTRGFTRVTTTITTDADGEVSGSLLTLGGSYVLLSAQANAFPCRIRLYNDSASVDADRSRLSTNTDVADTTGLIADISLDNLAQLRFNPPILAFPLKTGQTWYNVSSSAGTETTVTLESYPFVGSGDSNTDRSEITLYTSNISTTSYGESGSFASPKAFVILTGSMYRNLTYDPTYKDGDVTDDGNGWQFLYASKSVANLGVSDGVTQPFPQYTNTIAAKIATRTSAYQLSNSFQFIPVTAGNTYRIAGYVYGEGTTLGGYPLGFFVNTLDGSNSSLGYQNVQTAASPVGWNYVSRDVVVGAGTASIQVGPFMDGPYPNGYGYGEPTCSAAYNLNPLACPGYAWFVGPHVINITEGEVNGLAARMKLYSTPMSEVPSTEQTRSFTSIPPDDSSKLIGDFSFDSSSRSYKLTPVVEGYTWSGSRYIQGTGRTSYQIQNTSPGGSYTNEDFVITLLTHKIEN